MKTTTEQDPKQTSPAPGAEEKRCRCREHHHRPEPLTSPGPASSWLNPLDGSGKPDGAPGADTWDWLAPLAPIAAPEEEACGPECGCRKEK
jgi:hypothetical protein